MDKPDTNGQPISYMRKRQNRIIYLRETNAFRHINKPAVHFASSLKLIIGGDIYIIKQVSSVKSLGVHIDENLSWNLHIEKIAKKIASGIGAIKRCRPFVNRTTLECVLNALVQPYFNYCSEFWGHCNKSLSNKLQKLQNRAARILTFSSYDTSADSLFEQLNWKWLDTQRQIQVATMVYKSIHGLAHDYLSSLFTKYDPPYNLRNSENELAVPLPRTNFLKNSFSYNGAVIWNSLSPELRQAKSLQSFRNGCRDRLRLNRQNAHGIYVKQNFFIFSIFTIYMYIFRPCLYRLK